MHILAFETTGPRGSAAVIDQDGRVTMKTSCEEMNHLKDLMPMAQQLIDDLGIEKKDLSALDIPAIAVPTLDSFKVKCCAGDVIVPVFNARRGQIYGGIFDEFGGDIMKSGPYMLADCFTALDSFLGERPASEAKETPTVITVRFFGDGIDAYEAQLRRFAEEIEQKYSFVRICFAEKKHRYQTAEMTARCALKKYEKKELVAAEGLLPDYMRATEAEQKLKDGSLARERAAKLERFRSR